MRKTERIIDIVITILNLVSFLLYAITGILNHDSYHVSMACLSLILGLHFANKLTSNK